MNTVFRQKIQRAYNLTNHPSVSLGYSSIRSNSLHTNVQYTSLLVWSGQNFFLYHFFFLIRTLCFIKNISMVSFWEINTAIWRTMVTVSEKFSSIPLVMSTTVMLLIKVKLESFTKNMIFWGNMVKVRDNLQHSSPLAW